jgi:phosphopantetheine adenylyltransferase
VKEVVHLGGSVRNFVPPVVDRRLREKEAAARRRPTRRA